MAVGVSASGGDADRPADLDDRPGVYLAGPEVFLPDAAELARAKVAICARHGLRGEHPFDAVEALGPLDHLDPPGQAAAFYAALVAQIDRCAAVIANMTPFRGPSTDVGTAWEMGYAAGRGLLVLAYTNTTEHYAARVEPDGLVVEAFDLADNLMLEGSVVAGGAVVERRSSTGSGADALRPLDGFEVCVRRAVARLGTGA